MHVESDERRLVLGIHITISKDLTELLQLTRDFIVVKHQSVLFLLESLV